MTRIDRPQFGTRQHRPSPNWYRPPPPPAKPSRIDWQVVSLVAIVFFGSIVWLLPALEQGGLLDGVLKGRDDAPRRATSSSSVQVVDGDTVRSGGRTYRLVGFNTPEQGTRAACAEERALAAEAKDRLRALVAAPDAQLSRVPCACAPGTEGTETCNFGRLCGRLKADGRDVGQILIAEGLAEPYVCGGTSCPPRKDWCAG